jgi:hypothetical protein
MLSDIRASSYPHLLSSILAVPMCLRLTWRSLPLSVLSLCLRLLLTILPGCLCSASERRLRRVRLVVGGLTCLLWEVIVLCRVT